MTSPILISQHGLPSVPGSDELEEAVLWDYRFEFLPANEVKFEVRFNEKRTVCCSIVLEDAGGLAQARVTASSGPSPLLLFPGTTPVPVGAAQQFCKADLTMLTFDEASAAESWTVVFPRLDVLDVQSARLTMGEVTFDRPLLPFVENAREIDIGGTKATLAGHLTSLLDALLGNSPFASQPLSLACHYRYEIGGIPVQAPVVLVMRQDVAIGFDEQLVEQIATSIRHWLDAVQPPEAGASLCLEITCWSALPRIDVPLLRLGSVVLPMGDVVPA